MRRALVRHELVLDAGFCERLLEGGGSFQTVTGKGYSPGVMKLGKWRWVGPGDSRSLGWP